MRVAVLGVEFDNVTLQEAVERAAALMENPGPHRVVTPNPEIVELCREDPEVMEAVNTADLILPDGIGILRGAALLGTPLQERVPGVEFAAALAAKLAQTGHSLYLLGGRPGVAAAAAEQMRRQYPGLVIAGHRDGYFESDAAAALAIRQSDAACVFVCLGAPKQELWMHRFGKQTGAALLCGLGGSIDIFSGQTRRAPRFWCDHGLEWLYRIIKDPRRLGRSVRLWRFMGHVRREKRRRG